MDRVNEIIFNETYKEALSKLNKFEENRVFCKHNIEHFLDLARIAYIEVLEKGLNYNKEVIYAIALLHDIGRVLEYENKTPHNKGSVIMAKDILKEIGFSGEEKSIIMKCIESHREEGDLELAKIICKSDKLSRKCFSCEVEKECYWDKHKKNTKIII